MFCAFRHKTGSALEPMYRPVVELTEFLRHKTPGDYEGLLSTINSRRAELLDLIKD